jgi:hypothetical protein
MRERVVGAILGFLGGLFLIIQAIVDFLVDLALLVVNHSVVRGEAGTLGLIPAVFAVLIWVFAFLGASSRRGLELTSGVVLVVLAVVGALVAGFPGPVLWLLAIVFTLLSGVVFLVGQASRA